GPVEELRSPQGGAPRRGDDELQTLRREARESGVTLLAVRPEVRWDQLQSVCRSIVDDARLTTAEDLTEAGGDLFSMAQTIARLTGGLVSIEDSASRVLAYSSGAEVDELRRLSVLGRRGPESYLALLRQWGVFAKLRSGEEVVHIDEHPELGDRKSTRLNSSHVSSFPTRRSSDLAHRGPGEHRGLRQPGPGLLQRRRGRRTASPVGPGSAWPRVLPGPAPSVGCVRQTAFRGGGRAHRRTPRTGHPPPPRDRYPRRTPTPGHHLGAGGSSAVGRARRGGTCWRGPHPHDLNSY